MEDEFYIVIPLETNGDFSHASIVFMNADTIFDTGLVDFTDDLYRPMKMYFDFQHSTLIEPVVPTSNHQLLVSSSESLNSFNKACRIIVIEHWFYQTVSNHTIGITLGPTATLISMESELFCDNAGVYVPSNVVYDSGGTGVTPPAATPLLPTNTPLPVDPLRPGWLKCSSWDFTTMPRSNGLSAFTVLDNAYVQLYTAIASPNGGAAINSVRTFDYHVSLDIPIGPNVDPNGIDFVRCVNNAINVAEQGIVTEFANVTSYYTVPESTVYFSLNRNINITLGALNCGGVESNGLPVPPNFVEVQGGAWQNPNPSVISGANYGSYAGYILSCLW
ncbi:MAG: hypothetical protein AB8H12_09135 [Lewinella sp.]